MKKICLDMSTAVSPRNKWVYGGALILVAASALFLFDSPSAWTPLPLPILIVAFISLSSLPSSNFFALVFVPFVIALQYVLILKLFYGSNHLPKIVFFLIVILGILNLLYFLNAWDYGLKWQGEFHTKIVATENFLGFSIALCLSSLSLTKQSQQLALLANMLLFFLLSWCAFPLLGEFL
jgi:hypothetical protein